MSAVIFDFDGTIANSYPVIIDIFHQLTRLPTPDIKERQRLRKLPLHSLAGELHIPRWRVPFLLRRGRQLMKQRIGEVQIFAGMPETIKKLHAHHDLYVVSSNDTKAITKFLKQHKLDNYFTQINGSVGLFSKARSLHQLLNRNHIKRGDCYYVGDEVRDIEAALKCGVKQIAVTWGYNDADLLKAYYPTAIVDSPQQLLKVITSAAVDKKLE